MGVGFSMSLWSDVRGVFLTGAGIVLATGMITVYGLNGIGPVLRKAPSRYSAGKSADNSDATNLTRCLQGPSELPPEIKWSLFTQFWTYAVLWVFFFYSFEWFKNKNRDHLYYLALCGGVSALWSLLLPILVNCIGPHCVWLFSQIILTTSIFLFLAFEPGDQTAGGVMTILLSLPLAVTEVLPWCIATLSTR